MRRSLIINIDSGEKTCFDAKASKMCTNVLTSRFGTVFTCGLFNEELSSDDQRYDGQLERCRQCKAAEDLAKKQKDEIQDQVWARFHDDQMMFDYPRYTWRELMRKIKDLW